MSLAIDVVTIFPGMIAGPVSEGIVGRAAAAGLVRIAAHDLREHTDDKHRTADDSPFGGGPGMVMKAEPFFRAVEAIGGEPAERRAVVLLSPRGAPFDQARAARYAGLERLVLLCGRYEGIDERVREGLEAEEVSVGDFVLTGGEVAALAVIEATVRLLPGARLLGTGGDFGANVTLRSAAGLTVEAAGSVLWNVPYCLRRRQPVRAPDFELPLS